MSKIKKRRENSIEQEKLEALLRRIPKSHPSWYKVESRLARCISGLYGEKSLDYYISHIPHEELFIFQSLRLPLPDDSFFQMDFLLLAPETIIILDSKNHKGRIFIEENQMTRELNDEIESFSNPIQQVENQLFHLIGLLRRSSFPIPPTAAFVVFTHQSSIILSNSAYPAVAKQVIRPDAIRQRVGNFHRQHSRKIFTRKEMLQLSRLFVKLHTPENPDVLKKYKVDQNELLTGIYCETCKSFTVVKERVWICQRCKKIDNTAPIRALLDYFYLIGEEITNAKCRQFLRIPSQSVTKALLCSLNLEVIGKGRATTHKLSIKALKSKL
ncbi:NERD domain-containing protein [Lederbergia sp. NSJ-179]|uniref:NERD domain-containing protein n=1 Tax=Lederbergia sp. NSJ-179 TaxID=2931402 RepID=UPI001FD06EF2|nr:NERD domain-containing protein [Lederbergia sp. NSJ-179]MCJ7841518.1 NERD domain-containing protein [Lederbergia sp. NSJ-179]